jgi:hypothetical protein
LDSTEKTGHRGWNPLKSQAIPNGICPAAIYMMLFPLGYLRMQATEEMGYLDLTTSINLVNKCNWAGLGLLYLTGLKTVEAQQQLNTFNCSYVAAFSNYYCNTVVGQIQH